MSISKPYYRILRPNTESCSYVRDTRYAPDRLQLARAYINIEKKLREIFNYIEPDERNLGTFSFELYTLLLRACTEVELNCQLILKANGAKPSGKYFTMEDYRKLEKSSLLSKYKIILPNWKSTTSDESVEYGKYEFFPFEDFGINKKPQWYQAYNHVKHDREGKLEEANFKNCIQAVGAILALIYSQFGGYCIEPFNNDCKVYAMNEDRYDGIFDADVIFEVVPPRREDWDDEEKYEFNWKKLKTVGMPFQKFDFNAVNIKRNAEEDCKEKQTLETADEDMSSNLTS